MGKKVAIVGFASSSRHLAPFGDPGFEIWTMNHAPLSWIPKWDVLFELHTLEHLTTIAAHDQSPEKYLDWLKSRPAGKEPVYMQQAYEFIPASVKIPREELNAWFAERGGNVEGYFADDYYTSTVSFMLAMAIMKGAPEIHIYGVDLLQDEEYSYQRTGCEYLVGLARGMGIKVYIPRTSALCKANYVYGFSEPAVAFESESIRPLIKYVEDKAKLSDSMVERARQDANTFNGAVQMADLVLQWMKEGKDVGAMVTEKRNELQGKFSGARDSVMTMVGQSEAFRTTVVWANHFARGGALTL